MKCLTKHAFTLVELLIVVIVIGVLAGVAVPKFKRVLDTRKTTEAENMLAAVRTEQEKRCIMGKNYVTDASKIDALANASKSKNYTYSLSSTGATAAGNGYELKIPSYKNGQICCEGDGCDKLNKNYIRCDTLALPEDECKSAEAAAATTTTVIDCGEKPANETQLNGVCTQAREAMSCDQSTGEWIWGDWTNVSCMCPNEVEEREKGDCTQTRQNVCDYSTGQIVSYGEWQDSALCSSCTPKDKDIGYGTSIGDTCNGDRTGRYTCDGTKNVTCYDVYAMEMTLTGKLSDISSFSNNHLVLDQLTNLAASNFRNATANSHFFVNMDKAQAVTNRAALWESGVVTGNVPAAAAAGFTNLASYAVGDPFANFRQGILMAAGGASAQVTTNLAVDLKPVTGGAGMQQTCGGSTTSQYPYCGKQYWNLNCGAMGSNEQGTGCAYPVRAGGGCDGGAYCISTKCSSGFEIGGNCAPDPNGPNIEPIVPDPVEPEPPCEESGTCTKTKTIYLAREVTCCAN